MQKCFVRDFCILFCCVKSSDQILLEFLGAFLAVGAHGNHELDLLALGIVGEPEDEGHDVCFLTVIDELIEIIDKEVGNVIVAGVDARDKALEKFIGADVVAAGVDQAGLIGNVVSELAFLLDDDHVAFALADSLADKSNKFLRFSGALEPHNDFKHNDMHSFFVKIVMGIS